MNQAAPVKNMGRINENAPVPESGTGATTESRAQEAPPQGGCAEAVPAMASRRLLSQAIHDLGDCVERAPVGVETLQSHP